MSEGGEARNHEAEVEAVARALWDDHEAVYATGEQSQGRAYTPVPWEKADDTFDKPEYRFRADHAIEALDAVRRSPQGEDHVCYIENGHCQYAGCFRRGPQGEDHEAFLRRTLAKTGWSDPMIDGLLTDLRLYLSRCPSPERAMEWSGAT